MRAGARGFAPAVSTILTPFSMMTSAVLVVGDGPDRRRIVRLTPKGRSVAPGSGISSASVLGRRLGERGEEAERARFATAATSSARPTRSSRRRRSGARHRSLGETRGQHGGLLVRLSREVRLDVNPCLPSLWIREQRRSTRAGRGRGTTPRWIRLNAPRPAQRLRPRRWPTAIVRRAGSRDRRRALSSSPASTGSFCAGGSLVDAEHAHDGRRCAVLYRASLRLFDADPPTARAR